MPTVILLDVSLSMLRPLKLADNSEITRKQLAVHGIHMFLDHLSVHSKLEFISLVTFSSIYEEKCSFTRDYNVIKSELKSIDDYDKTCIEIAFNGINQIVLNEWGNNTACQVILVTDGSSGIGPGSLKDSLSTINQRGAANPFPVPFAFPTKLHVVCIAPPNDISLIKSKPLYQKLIDISGYEGSINIPDGQLNEQSVQTIFQKLADEMYASFKGSLKCGHLESSIYLTPAPIPYTKVTDFEVNTSTVSNVIEVCGFISVGDIGSPMAVSRHLILPAGSPKDKLNNSGEMSVDYESDNSDDDKAPSFCVLFHGALKVENMAALVSVADNWFGFIYSWADSKKKSNLMLTLLVPGSDSVPWLGDLNNLHSLDGVPCDSVLNFPLKSSEKRSYSQNSVVWIRQAGLQSDIQKILRHAKKLPEKTQQFYKELNRLRKAAIQLGFMDLLTGLAFIFEQECTQLPGSAHPDCALQLTHAADALRKPPNIKHVIVPMQTNYTGSNQ
ncbi:PREDICTED: von Willebrand factor A domain-containing protein 9 [Nicrophorus vespilloides]|uniref:Integrator complex subunit 14 n=1 Tax=Nicrophorus vespilloides TaxID=110193 RepID=A0ABM1NEC6_NICVS|nr:PREDICTED: von Willebrand factor A domain-containing protein 9 [Nicrophorus vespilloides]